MYQVDMYVTEVRDPSPRIPSSSNKNCRYMIYLQKFIDEEIYLFLKNKALLIILDHVSLKYKKLSCAILFICPQILNVRAIFAI